MSAQNALVIGGEDEGNNQQSSAESQDLGGSQPMSQQESQEMILIQHLLGTMSDRIQSMADQILGKIDTMGKRVDDLEKSMMDLMAQAGVDPGTGRPNAPATTATAQPSNTNSSSSTK